MNKKIFNFLLILLVSLLFIGCNGVPKTAQLKLSLDPNPATYDNGINGWPFILTVAEQNGVGVTLTEFTFKTYNSNNQLLATDVFDSNDIADKIDNNYLSAFSSVDLDLSRSDNTNGIKYAISLNTILLYDS